MTEVLLTHCSHLYFDRKQVRKMQPFPPLQTLIAAALFRQEGIDAALFDCTLVPPEAGFRKALERHRPKLVAICEDGFNFITKMCLTRNRELAFALARICREAAVPVVVHSSDATDHAADYLDQGMDFVVAGEPEQTLLETARVLLRHSVRPVREIRGLVYRHEGAICRNPPRARMKDLDELPRPAWDLVDLERYRHAWVGAHGFFSLNMVTSRGCPYHCNWCAKPIFGQAYQTNSPRHVAREMLFVKTHLRPDQIWFADDIFGLSVPWVLEFADAVEQLQAGLPFKMQSRCDLMTHDVASALRRAGCAEVWMGAESGSQRILDAMEKGIRLEHIKEARENLKQHGIRACFFLQFGFPGERWDDIQSTIRLVRETEPDEIGVSVSYPLPGTKFYHRVAAQLEGKRNWSDSDDLSMMFRGSYANEMYQALHDALHMEIELRRQSGGTGKASERLRLLWARVEELEKTCANPEPTPLWTSC